MELLVGWVVLAALVGVVAVNRGRSWPGWFLLSVFLSPAIGLIAVLVLPNMKTAYAERETRIDPSTHVRCPECRELVRRDARKCKHCGTALVPQALEG